MAEAAPQPPAFSMANFSLQAGLRRKRRDIFFAVGIIAILITLILPLPPFMLDFALGVSLTLSVTILMTVLFVEKPLHLSSFPTILLIVTMLRLSLNIASVRLILSHGHEGPAAAGHVIQAFGGFVMGGQIVIGAIIFGILTIINFVVITKGSGRIAEVSARFSLDAMPGKQMAIDADLSAGLITEDVAKARRKELEDESNFFGAMDGASKFVRGDAIAGLLIVFINFIAGIIIGMVQNGLSFDQALRTYTTLTVGDGLVTQIPALIVSTAAGILVTKSGVSGSAEKAVLGQLGRNPTPIGITSGFLVAMAALPGIPAIPFLLLSGATGYACCYMFKNPDALQPGAAGAPGRPSNCPAPTANAVPKASPPKNSPPTSCRSIRCGSSWAMACCRSSITRKVIGSPSKSRRCAARWHANSASSFRPCASRTTCSCRRILTSSRSRKSKRRAATSSPTCCW